MDEILLANFMVFHDVVRDDHYDLWLGDEAWELDYFLHENPELKTRAVRLPDRLRRLAADATGRARGAHHRRLQRREHRAGRALPVRPRRRGLRRRAGGRRRRSTSGLACRRCRDWVERHFDFAGYVLPFDPADYADTERLRRELGFDPGRPLVVGAVGGSGVGVHLLRRIAAAFAELRKRRARTPSCCSSCGPRDRPARDSAGRGHARASATSTTSSAPSPAATWPSCRAA